MGLSKKSRRGSGTVSVVILAYNEAGNLPKTVAAIHQAICDRFSAYEIIIVDDGSRDETGHIADNIAARDPRVVSLHNPKNMGCGYTFMRGAREAKCEYVWLIPGDGEIDRTAISVIAGHIGEADMVIPYVSNFRSRLLERRIVSWGYTTLVNILFFKRLHYYNGPCVFLTSQVKTLPTVKSRGFAFMAPIILRLMKRGCSYAEVKIELKPRLYGKPSISSLKNIFSALKTLMRLFPDIYFREERRGDLN